MLMLFGIIGFLLFIVFLVKGFISIFRKKNFKKDFMIALASFILFAVMATIDGSNDPKEVAKNKEQVATKEVKEASKEVATNDSKESSTDESKNAAKKADVKASSASSHGEQATVTRVVDGDTIHVSLKGKDETIRMLLLDTPETVDPNKPVEPFGKDASNFAKQTLSGKTVGIQVGSEPRDKYGRLLAYVWVGNKTYQEMVLEKGLGRTAYLYNDTSMLDQFHKAQDIAKNQGIGVWSIPDYAHVDHNHGYHYQEEKKEETVQTPVQKPVPKPAPQPTPEPAPTTEFFQNCTDMRTVYPNGVPSSHPAYQAKMDRDKDNFACER
ncbi:thermonuclease family protein [Priestia sp. AB]|uniref:thermonuclease family protein n=1 Tax=Priestia sp. AB TaxID=3020890 RepID=UPI00232B00AB|nr:thermonuclease family protein [Priestia sp. AB]MDC0706378.1 thermonuclease family protein [Priestia sp. AB]